MSQKFLFDEDHQLPIRIMRCVIWSVLMIVVWAIPAGIMAASGVIYVLSSPEVQQEDGPGIFAGLVVLCVGFLFPILVCGLLTGTCAAFCAEQEQPFWPAPSRSPTFWRFCKRIPMTLLPTLLLVFGIFALLPGISLMIITLVPIALLLALTECIEKENKRKAA